MDIRLFAIKLDRPLTEEEERALSELMPPERRERLRRTKSAANRNEHICAYTALRYGLYQVFGWRELPELSYSRYGKPYFTAHDDVHFNISHTRGAVLVGIHDSPIGVDIEKIRPVSERMMQRIARVTTEKEFYESWVRRESRGKWAGNGLAAINAADSPTMLGEKFHFVETFEGYAACVCTHSTDEIAPLQKFRLEDMQ